MTEPELPESASPHVVPRQTTPTWEMELLVSGLTVFALLQLPGLLDGWYLALINRIELEYGSLLMLTYLYVKAAVMALALTFIVHLALRGYWVALIGMRSVYPEGIRWDQLRMGPHFRAVSHRLTRPMPELIERSDNRATTVFAVGVGLAMVMLAPIFAMTLSFLVTFALRAVLPGWEWQTLFFTACTLTLGPFMLALAIDRFAGQHVREGTVLARAIRGTLAGYTVLGLGRTTSPLVAVFQSHVGARKGTMFIMVAMLVMFGIVFAQLMTNVGALRLDNFRYLPRDRIGASSSLRPEYYAPTRRGVESSMMMPFIQADIVKDPFVRLFVPYDPARHNFAIGKSCAAVPAEPVARERDPDGAAEAARRTALLDCVATLMPLAIDGTPVATRYDFGSEAQRGEFGFIAMIDVRDLARGRHELTVGRPPRHDTPADEVVQPHRIPFWR